MTAATGNRVAVRLAIAAGVVLACGALVAGGVWWWLSYPRTPPLEPGWAATVGVVPADVPLVDPFGVAAAPDGTVYVSEGGDAPRILRVLPDGRSITVAGGVPGFTDGAGPMARFNAPSAIALDPSGTLYVADTGNNAIRRVSPDGVVTTIAGGPEAGYVDGPAAGARFNGPVGIALSPGGRVIVADTYNDRIRAIDPGGTVVTLAGGAGPGAVDGGADQARFDTPCGVAVDGAGNILVADTGNGLVRRIDPGGVVTTITAGFTALARPLGIAVAAEGEIYVTDERGRVLELHPTGTGRVVAGSRPGFRDGAGDAAQFRRPAGVTLAASGRLVIADTGNALLRLVAATSRLELRLPASPHINPRFDAERFGVHRLLWPVTPMSGPHEIAGTMGEARGEGAERFHSGIDVRVEQGTPVQAIRDGVVSSPLAAGDFGSLNESIRIGDVAYIHVRVGRDRHNALFDADRFVPTYDEGGRLTAIRLKRGARFETGEVIATANAFNHVHLNVGWPGEEYNPLDFELVQFEDRISPTIPRNGVRLYDEAGVPFSAKRAARTLVAGRVRIVVDAWDQADGNRASRRLGLYALGYQILNRDGSPAPGFERPPDTIRFNRAASTPDAPRLVFAPGSGIPFYGGRVTRFLYTVTNTFRGGQAAEGFWDTAAHEPGDYTVRAWAEDVRGNRTTRDVAVTIPHLTTPDAQLPPPKPPR